MTVAGLLLAAGAGTRIGGPKALLELDGRTLLARGITMLRDGGCDLVVVIVGAAAEQVSALVVAADAVVAAGWQEGLGGSLRAGLEALDTTPATACVVALVDQPLVGADAVRRLCATAGRTKAAVATYDGKQRNPVLLDRSIWAAVAALATGDVGARAWLRAHADQVLDVPCDGTGSPADIDTPADYESMRSELS